MGLTWLDAERARAYAWMGTDGQWLINEANGAGGSIVREAALEEIIEARLLTLENDRIRRWQMPHSRPPVWLNMAVTPLLHRIYLNALRAQTAQVEVQGV